MKDETILTTELDGIIYCLTCAFEVSSAMIDKCHQEGFLEKAGEYREKAKLFKERWENIDEEVEYEDYDKAVKLFKDPKGAMATKPLRERIIEVARENDARSKERRRL